MREGHGCSAGNAIPENATALWKKPKGLPDDSWIEAVLSVNIGVPSMSTRELVTR
jgi:hypothetical protein